MAEGFKGTIDWAGYSVGGLPSTPAGGFIGLLDFTGIAVGVLSGEPEPPVELQNIGFLTNVGRLGLR